MNFVATVKQRMQCTNSNQLKNCCGGKWYMGKCSFPLISQIQLLESTSNDGNFLAEMNVRCYSRTKIWRLVGSELVVIGALSRDQSCCYHGAMVLVPLGRWPRDCAVRCRCSWMGINDMYVKVIICLFQWHLQKCLHNGWHLKRLVTKFMDAEMHAKLHTFAELTLGVFQYSFTAQSGHIIWR